MENFFLNNWVARALDELVDFRADEADVVRAVMKLTIETDCWQRTQRQTQTH